MGAVHGVRTHDDGSRLAFCDLIEFGNTKCTTVRRITSFADAEPD